MKIALVHDWLNGMRGGEKVLEVLCELYPEATIYTLLYEPEFVSETIRKMKVIPSPILPKFPWGRKKYRHYLPLFPLMIEQFNLKEYDVVISTSHCVAKGALTRTDAIHICYCFTPMRYVWDMYHEYFSIHPTSRLTRFIAPIATSYLRLWDQSSQSRVDYFIAISNNIAAKIKKYYRRDSCVIYPPADTEYYHPVDYQDNEYYLIVSALVPYKRIDLAIQSFNQTGYPLKIAGVGPEFEHLKSISKPNIQFLGWVSDSQLRELYSGCKAMIFPGEEDFGITPLEAMSCGRPVIALAKGGALETVTHGKTGLLFQDATPQSLTNALQEFQNITFDSTQIRNAALPFDRKLFKFHLHSTINQLIQDSNNNIHKSSDLVYNTSRGSIQK